MAPVPVQSVQIDFPQITTDLLAFYDQAIQEANQRAADSGQKTTDYTELFYTNRAKIEASLKLSHDPATLQHAVEKEALFMKKHASRPAPDTYKKFQVYIAELQKKLKNIIDQGLVNPADEAKLKALFEGAQAGGLLVAPWYMKNTTWIVGGTIIAGFGLWWWWRR